jgi:hypothetical protein
MGYGYAAPGLGTWFPDELKRFSSDLASFYFLLSEFTTYHLYVMLPMYIGYMMVFKKKVIECFFLNFLNI